jgi:hypothetical protein
VAKPPKRKTTPATPVHPRSAVRGRVSSEPGLHGHAALGAAAVHGDQARTVLRVTGDIVLREPQIDAVRDMIRAVEQQTREELARARAQFKHKGNRGTGGEEAVRTLLRSHLPRRLDIGRGEVIDTYGGRSAETDVIICNEDQPFTYARESPGLYLIEGVAAVGEVKAVLTTAFLRQAVEKSVRFKELRPTGTNIMGMVGPRDPNAFGENPPAFLFAYSSRMPLETIISTLKEQQSVHEPSQRMLEGVFCLDRGAAIDIGDGSGPLKVKGPDGKMQRGWVEIARSDVTFQFLAWLSMSMRRMFRSDSILTKYLLPHVIGDLKDLPING